MEQAVVELPLTSHLTTFKQLALLLMIRKSSITVSAIYCRPKHKTISKKLYNFFSTLGKKIIVCGDYSAKKNTNGFQMNYN